MGLTMAPTLKHEGMGPPVASEEIMLETRWDSRLRDIEEGLYGAPQNRGGIARTVRGMAANWTISASSCEVPS